MSVNADDAQLAVSNQFVWHAPRSLHSPHNLTSRTLWMEGAAKDGRGWMGRGWMGRGWMGWVDGDMGSIHAGQGTSKGRKEICRFAFAGRVLQADDSEDGGVHCASSTIKQPTNQPHSLTHSLTSRFFSLLSLISPPHNECASCHSLTH